MEYIALAVGFICVTFLICLYVGYRAEEQDRLDAQKQDDEVTDTEEQFDDKEAFVEAPALKVVEASEPEPVPKSKENGERLADVTSALQNLGFKKQESSDWAKQAVERTPGGSLGDAIKAAFEIRSEG